MVFWIPKSFAYSVAKSAFDDPPIGRTNQSPFGRVGIRSVVEVVGKEDHRRLRNAVKSVNETVRIGELDGDRLSSRFCCSLSISLVDSCFQRITKDYRGKHAHNSFLEPKRRYGQDDKRRECRG